MTFPARALWRTRKFACLALLGSMLNGCSDEGPAYPDFSRVVQKASPTIVNISTVAMPEGESLDFPGYQSPEGGGADGNGALEPQSLGSGFVLWADGYVLTNFHVVSGASEIVVRLLDRRQFTATVVGTDERSDLALLRIDARDLDAVTIGDSERLSPGQWVLAIGSPFGFDYSVTAGIVSAKGRSLVSEQYVPFIQTDVAINPGNSGGPLFNLEGEVVGINSQIYSESGGYQGVSFAIPIDVAAKVAQQLRDHGKVTRGWLGVVVQEVTRDLASSLGMERPVGVLVSRVVPGSPSEQSGLVPGDVILRYDGEEVAQSSELPPRIGDTEPGRRVRLDVQRGAERLSIEVEVGQLDGPEGALESAENADEIPNAAAVLGLIVSPLSDGHRDLFQVLGSGVVVDEVLPGPAAAAGIRRGDLLMSIAGQDVESPERLARIVGRLTPGGTVPVLISRNGSATFLPLKVPQVTIVP